ncbi:hypothetical protein A3G69_01320 [Candidatus Peribacteria bacterium RIFCSPLOWO2_12_FULL_53_10]|nr:MAG: hypothetical protein A3B61_05320 [Candidatus Peribacteria bacterium RIFCSPLOWO2_01_FULL_53_10]OGJ75015.1 MAG: hypothetical protein A3G69_01320 [Candidatus Peribacteria bacterium RIFCSPLOWO2_12_FULL_53_10]
MSNCIGTARYQNTPIAINITTKKTAKLLRIHIDIGLPGIATPFAGVREQVNGYEHNAQTSFLQKEEAMYFTL